MSEEITKRDDKLLRREAYIRRERYVCLGLTGFCLFGVFAGFIVGEEASGSETLSRSALTVIPFLLGYAYWCTLRIRHIESIKAYRSEGSTESESPTT